MKPKLPTDSIFPRINTLRFKISVVYVALIGLILVLFQAIFYFNYANSVSKEFDAQLAMKAEQIGGAVNTFRGMLGDQRQALTLAAQQAINLGIEYPQYTFMPESPEKFWLADARKLGLDKDYLVIMDSQGGIIAKSSNVTQRLFSYFNKIGQLNLDTGRFYGFNLNGNALRIIVVPYYYAYRQGYTIAVGSPYGTVERALWQHLLFVIGSTLIFLVIASLIARVFVVRVLSSVMEISKVARNITQENLHERIKLTHTDQEIGHLTGSLNNMIARLEKSFGDIKDFSMEMAHEVKTPLAIISGESQLALEGKHTAEEYQETFRTVLKEAKRTQRFVSDLLLLTKLDYRLVQLRFETIDLSQFIPETCQEMRVICNPQKVTISENMGSGPISIKGDRIHLRRIFFNLIDNALKFTPPGGRVDMAVERSDQKCVILVSDTGCGIAPDEVSKIFHKFYSTGNSHLNHGCGLGLSIVRSIVELHGGSITVHSEVGKGTTFRIELPFI